MTCFDFIGRLFYPISDLTSTVCDWSIFTSNDKKLRTKFDPWWVIKENFRVRLNHTQSMSWQVTSFEGEALYALQDKFRKMAEQAEQQPCSSESPTRYSLPPAKKQKGRASRKTKLAP